MVVMLISIHVWRLWFYLCGEFILFYRMVMEIRGKTYVTLLQEKNVSRVTLQEFKIRGKTYVTLLQEKNVSRVTLQEFNIRYKLL